MANSVISNPLILDTAGSTIYQPGGIAVKLVRWVEAARPLGIP